MKKHAVLLVFLSSPVAAEPGPTVSWIMNTPMSLFDRGMDRLNGDIKSSVQYATDRPEDSTSFGYASYDYSLNEISMVVTVSPKTPMTADQCIRYRKNIEFLTYFGGDTDAERRENIANFLERQFAHSGYQETGRPEKLGENLASIVFTEVRISQPSPSREILSCRGRIGEATPAIKTEQRPGPKGASSAK